MIIAQNTTVLESAVESSSSTPPVTDSPTENVNETLISVPNQTAMPANETERSANSSAAGLNDMGQILMKFFGQILPTDSTVSNQTEAPPVQVEEEIVLVKNGTSLESHPSPQPVEASSNQTISVNGTVPLSEPSNATNAEPVKQASGAGQGVLTRLRGNNPNRPTGGDTCSQHSCLEWSTEKLLKARLCCLNSPEEETIRPSSTNSSVASLTAEKSTEEGDSAESVNDGSFGCQLYAKRKCSSIMPIIKCCLRKVLSKYFDFTIKLREQQQKAALAGRRHGSMVMTSSGLVADPKAQRFQDPRILEYPGDYALGGRGGSQYQPGEYFKQQHRKRVDGRTKMLSQQRR